MAGLIEPSEDGVDVRAIDEGRGRIVLVLHPGFDDGSSWRRVASRLATRFRVVRPHRRQYRLDAVGPRPWSIADEVADVLALVEALGEPVLVVGHSSGAVVALEAMVAAPPAFAGAVLYEPPVHLRPGEWTGWIAEATAALAACRPGTAMAIFTREVVGLPAWTARAVGLLTAAVPRYRALVPRQLADAQAVQDLGVRLAAYAEPQTPTVLLTGARSPAHLRDRITALAATLPDVTTVELPGQGHDAQLRDAEAVTQVIEQLADQVWPA